MILKVSRAARILMLYLGCLAACSTNPSREYGVSPDHPQTETQVAQPQRLESVAHLRAAAWTEVLLYLWYEADGVDHFVVTSHDEHQNLSIQLSWFPVYQLLPTTRAEFDTAHEQTHQIRTLTVDQWSAFTSHLINGLTPEMPNHGLLINTRDREYVSYRDSSDQLVVVDNLYEKPAEIKLDDTVRIEAMTDEIFELLDPFLDRLDIFDRYIIVPTGEIGPYARPFIAIDRVEEALEYLSLEAFTFGSVPSSFAVSVGKNGTHIVRSYLIEPFNRPVTFVSRLFYLVFDVARDSARGIGIRTLRFPSLGNQEIPPVNNGEQMNLAAWENTLEDMFGNNPYQGEVDVLIGGDAFFPRLVDVIGRATQSIKIRSYIFDRDDFVLRFTDFLKKRSLEVDVQVMMDGLGNIMAQSKAASTLPEDTEMPLGMTTHLVADSQIRVRNLTNPWLTGDHTKTTIVDSEYAFIGGMNFGREYRWEWHDVMMSVKGSIVDYIEWEFDKAWAQSGALGDFRLATKVVTDGPNKEPSTGYPVRPLVTKPRTSQIYRAQLAAIRNAKGYIYVENAYFSDTTVIFELARARLRGVDVRVIIPMEGNHGIMNKNNAVAANTLLQYGVRVFAYPGMSHIKAAVYDGWACLGSANFDKLSFRINKEMNLSSSDPRFTDQILEEIFEPDFAAAVELREPLPSDWSNSFASIAASLL
ncbi:MAG: phospholipase D-like domain-containing protein [Gammaproteobacteria bacterium]|nr:phospholipase D-like domain-containing protein [Gammaproteobacteria bacterium]